MTPEQQQQMAAMYQAYLDGLRRYLTLKGMK